ncbi:ATP-binding protein [Nocardioides plantarum]|uniref:histidine kinase n=1 Tax=Nocardioides plantarum TaxID=29299 RepID=A0ABV5K8E4_9ACTN|nr:ATP-binding protein [Nocardioides plantarum]
MRDPDAGPPVDADARGGHRLGDRVVLLVTALVCALFAVAFHPAVASLPTRQTVSALGLVLSGLFLVVASWRRTRTPAGRTRSWRLILVGSLVATAGNCWAAAVGSDPVNSPSTVSDVTIFVALFLCIAAMFGFPTVQRRGIEKVVIALDGLVISGAVVIIASTLVYDELLRDVDLDRRSSVLPLIIPALDILLIVSAVLLLLRSRGADRGALIFLALGFSSYSFSDLAFAVRVAQGDFQFGSYIDLGWIVGYALIALGAWYPGLAAGSRDDADRATTSDTVSSRGGADVRDTALVGLGLLVALAVQLRFGSARLDVLSITLWLLVVVAAVARQVVLTYDNTQLRRRLEDRVREQTSDLVRMARENETLLASVADGIYGVDAEGVLTFINPSGARALSYSSEQLHGRGVHELFHAPDAEGNPHPYDGCYIAEAIRSGLVTNAEEDVYVRADGSEFPVEITASPLVEGDSVRGAVVAFRDITQRREVDRLKNEFISVVSHELRTPLTSIRGSLGLLTSGKLGELTPRARSMATLALESSERLSRLINDILDLERIQSGTRAMSVAPVDSFELLARAVAEMSGMAHTKDISLELPHSDGRVLADADRIIQTLTNLINNAIKFSDPGQGVELSSVRQDDRVLFCVRDQGRGIPEDKLQTVFDRFEQVDSSDARALGGTGLGLAISRGIVERHGGRIWAESVLGEGTSVYFTLPSPDRGPSRRPAVAAGSPRGAATPHVLLVEDDDDLATALTTLLAGHAVAVTCVAGAAQALRTAETTTFDLVILDVVLAEGDGYELVHALRADPATADLDVIVYSADEVLPHDRPRLTLGRTEFLTKARVDLAGVEERVLQLLQTDSTRPKDAT